MGAPDASRLSSSSSVPPSGPPVSLMPNEPAVTPVQFGDEGKLMNRTRGLRTGRRCHVSVVVMSARQ